jgi:hypothetical protein
MATPKLKLPFQSDRIAYWESRYILKQGDDAEIKEAADRSLSAGYFEKSDLIAICHWKSPRVVPRCQENSDEFVRAVTKSALCSPSEEFRINAPTLLRGVGWRVSSVLLHFAHRESYPIIDFRVLWSLGWDLDAGRDDYDFEFWWNYVQFSREAVAKHSVSMRVLDRALWQYSKEKQK